MRKLKTPDIFNAMRMIKKAGLREDIKPVLKAAASGGLSIEDVGIDGILGMVEVLAEKKCEKAFYEVISGPFEMSVEQIEEMELNVFVEYLETLIKENDLKRFFTLLAGLNSKK